jgi:hypothetical protein
MLEAEFPEVIWCQGPRRGAGANRNFGVSHSRADWLIFVDDDCAPRPGFIAAYLAAFRSCGADQDVLFAGLTNRIGEGCDSLLWEAPKYGPEDGLPPSCNFGLSRELFVKSGGFDERFHFSFEDMEFFARLTQTGVPIRFLASAGVDHPCRPIPSARTLARRWESRVITSLDYGATVFETACLLPWHIILVTLSRFRGRHPTWEYLPAAKMFFCEIALTLAMLPGWLKFYGRRPLSPFWAEQVRLGKAPKNYGL